MVKVLLLQCALKSTFLLFKISRIIKKQKDRAIIFIALSFFDWKNYLSV